MLTMNKNQNTDILAHWIPVPYSETNKLMYTQTTSNEWNLWTDSMVTTYKVTTECHNLRKIITVINKIN